MQISEGATKKRLIKKILIISSIIEAAVLIGAIIFGRGSSDSRNGGMTSSKFDKIAIGMTRYQVETVVGTPGKIDSESSDGARYVQVLNWPVQRESANAMIRIENGLVTSKQKVNAGNSAP